MTEEKLPSGFVRLVRHALTHLYEPAELMKHPLREFLASRLAEAGSQAHPLRVYLLEAIDLLEPPGQASLTEKQRRPYSVLVDRYIGGLSLEEIGGKMHLSIRQVRREHEEGVQALAAYLWTLGRGVAPQESGTVEADDALESEVGALGVALEEGLLVRLVESARAPAWALASGAGAALWLDTQAAGSPCLYDSVLGKQALLSCLSALCAQHPQAIKVGPGGTPAAPSIEARVSPSLPAAAAGALAEALAMCTDLMKAQGGNVTMLVGGDGCCDGVRLWFRRQKGARVLLVDDNEQMLRLYGRYLAMGNHRMVAARSAPEARACLESGVPDIIVLDVMMRDVDGWELLQQLRSQPALNAVPIVVCSVLHEPQLASYLGAQATLKKPVTAEELLATVERVLAESSLG
ncbi:MAG: response regulator [Anaerolineae bacterium]